MTLRVIRAALPVVIGYVALGMPCGILGAQAGMSLLQILLLSIALYSGSGQYMIASLYMGGYAPLALSMSVVLVNARQLLYSSALLVRFEGVGRGRATLAASNITDETFGVNMAEYEKGGWGAGACFGTNCLAQATWTAANVAGAAIGALVPIEAGLAAFAMTSVFTCLLLMQGRQPGNLAAVCGTAAALVACKLAGLDRIAVFLAACVGIACGFVAGRRDGDNEQGSDNVRGDDTDALA